MLQKNLITKLYYNHIGQKNIARGFSLMEIVIYLGILALVMVGFITFFLSITRSGNKNFVIQEVQVNNRIALDTINQYIKSASGVNIADSTFDLDPGVLSLSMDDVSLNPTIISLNQDNGRLQITEGSNSPVYITSDDISVTYLEFNHVSTSNNHSHIRMQLTSKFDAPVQETEFQYSQSLQTAISIRQ